MTKLANIEVRYGRKVQTRPYENAEAYVAMSFVYDEEDGGKDVDTEISEAFATVVAHVYATLGIKDEHDQPRLQVETTDNVQAPAVAKKAPAKKAAPKAEEPATEEDPFDAPAPKKAAPKKAEPAAEEDPFDAPAGDEPEKVPSIGDVNAAVGSALDRLQKQGRSDGPVVIKDLIRAYLPSDAAPPFSQNKISEHGRADFIADLNKVGR